MKALDILKSLINMAILESRNCGNCNYNKAEDEFMIFCNKVVWEDGSRMMWHSYTREYCCKYWAKKETK